MVRHIILWTLHSELTEVEGRDVKGGVKEGCVSLAGKIPGLTDIKVTTQGRLASSNCDVMLESTIQDKSALQAYAKHPLRVQVADTKVRPYTVQRVCFDYEL